MARTKALPKPAALAAEAEALYVAEAKATKARVLSPVAATKAMAEKYGGGTARVASPVARVYYRKNGERNPLALSPDASGAEIRRMFDDPGYVGRGTKAATPASR